MNGKTDTISIETKEKLYTWFASVYLHEPAENQLKVFLNSETMAFFSSIFKGSPCRKALKELAAYFHKSTIEDVRTEFNSLFVVPNKGSYVPPYESCFREKNGNDFGNLWGNTTADVKKFYIETGNDVNDYKGIFAPDHIGVELAFVAKLCGIELGYLRQQDSTNADKTESIRRTFYETHIGRWVENYAKAVKASASSLFYGNLNVLLIQFLGLDFRN